MYVLDIDCQKVKKMDKNELSDFLNMIIDTQRLQTFRFAPTAKEAKRIIKEEYDGIIKDCPCCK